MSDKIELTRNMVSGTTGAEKHDMLFGEMLESPKGMTFILFREEHHTVQDVIKARKWLKKNRDVYRFITQRIKNGSNERQSD